MSKRLNEVNAVVPAAAVGTPGIYLIEQSGSFVLIEASSATFQIQFDSATPFDCKPGFKFSQNFSKLTLLNTSKNAISVTLATGDASVDYVGSNQIVEAATYAKGNLGCNSAAAVTALTTGAITGYNGFGPRAQSYKVGDVLLVAGGTFTVPASFSVQAVDNIGNPIAMKLANPGVYTVLPTLNGNNLTGGSGTGVSVNLTANASVSGLSYDSTNNFLIVTTSSNAFVPNFDGANPRKQIVFQVQNVLTGGQNSSSLQIFDANGNLFQTIAPGGVIAFNTSGVFYLKSLGEVSANPNCEFTIGELYYQN